MFKMCQVFYCVSTFSINYDAMCNTWWRHQMEAFSALLTLCARNSPTTGEFPAQRPVTRSFDDFFDLRLNKRFSKQSWGWRFETPPCPLWRHRNAPIAAHTHGTVSTVVPGRHWKLAISCNKSTWIILTLYVLKFQREHKHIFPYCVISPHLYDAGSYPSSNKTRTYLFYIVNIMAADVLAT